MRTNGRKPDELRPVKMTPNFFDYAEGSVLVEFGNTRVACAATVESFLPKWLQGSGRGWVTAEYGMLPRSTHTRIRREAAYDSGRSQEISRLIGRSLRAVTELEKLGERSITVDCDVLQADGGTRTAAVTGAFVALALALQNLRLSNQIQHIPLRDYVSAISVGLSENGPLLDLDYLEDSSIETDMNFVLTGKGDFVELQGTAEKNPFAASDLAQMTEIAKRGCQQLVQHQHKLIGHILPLK